MQAEENSKCTTPGCSLCPAVTAAIDETFKFSQTGCMSGSMQKLRDLVTSAKGSVAYYPGAMMDLTQPLAALGAEESCVHTLVCVSSFEV